MFPEPIPTRPLPPEDLAAVFADKPALHRFPRSMAGRITSSTICALAAMYNSISLRRWM